MATTTPENLPPAPTNLAIVEGNNVIPDGQEGVRAIAELARSASKIDVVNIGIDGLGPGLPKQIPALLDHRPGGGLTSIAPLIESYRLDPRRRHGTAEVTTLQSFIDLTNRHKDEHTAIFAKTSWPDPSLTTVVDYHQIDGTARHGKHRIRYTFPVTDEFKVWIEKNGKGMEQGEFAAFLEDHAAELSAPLDGERTEFEHLFKEKFATPHELIMLSRSLEVFVGAKVKRAERLASGERTVEFVEEHTNSKGEKVDIPGIFMIALPAFVDGDAVRIPARLRYRIAAGTIMWSYQLYRWQFWLRDQVKNDADRAADQTALPAYEGSPEA